MDPKEKKHGMAGVADSFRQLPQDRKTRAPAPRGGGTPGREPQADGTRSSQTGQMGSSTGKRAGFEGPAGARVNTLAKSELENKGIPTAQAVYQRGWLAEALYCCPSKGSLPQASAWRGLEET